MKEKLVDGHMHLEYGPLSKEYVLEFVKEAQNKGLDSIQILDHTHRFKEFEECYEPLKKYDVQKTWLENRKMKFKDSLDDYDKLIKEVKELELPIEVKFGLEVCYTPSSEKKLKEILSKHHYDFLVGAIHSIDDILYDMSFSKELLWDVWDINKIYERYYDLLIQCVNSKLFSQLAHPDTIKLFNCYPTYDLNPTYEKLSKVINDNGMLAECNTGCHYRYNHKDIGLSDELLEVFVRNNVKIITASDAHHPKDVGNFIKEASQRIKECKEKNSNV